MKRESRLGIELTALVALLFVGVALAHGQTEVAIGSDTVELLENDPLAKNLLIDLGVGYQTYFPSGIGPVADFRYVGRQRFSLESEIYYLIPDEVRRLGNAMLELYGYFHLMDRVVIAPVEVRKTSFLWLFGTFLRFPAQVRACLSVKAGMMTDLRLQPIYAAGLAFSMQSNLKVFIPSVNEERAAFFFDHLYLQVLVDPAGHLVSALGIEPTSDLARTVGACLGLNGTLRNVNIMRNGWVQLELGLIEKTLFARLNMGLGLVL